MLFNSLEFALFLPLVFLFYWFVVNKSVQSRNLFIIAISYCFYGWWDWRFLLLIAFTSGVSYLSGRMIALAKKQSNAKVVMITNVVINIAILCLFKYFNFFADNLAQLIAIFGYTLDWVTLDILLPVGISFYTFQALSYTIDVYRKKIEPTIDVAAFFAYVSFFPQLVAGPIERATNLLPQFYVKRQFDYHNAVQGLRLMLWGLFKKIVIADNCATIANYAFNNYETLNGATLLMGAVFFSLQIYGDFSGYSSIAIGTAKLFGFELHRNFNFPYFSRDISEFWRRWHISLSTWFRDYIYIPLGGSRGTKWSSFRNTVIIFLLSGLWHGANWTFVAWGAYHALLFLPLLLLGGNRKHSQGVVAQNRRLSSLKETLQVSLTFMLVVVGWIIFRAENIGSAFDFTAKMFSTLFCAAPQIPNLFVFAEIVFYVILMFVVEWFNREQASEFVLLPKCNIIRWGFYLAIAFMIFISYRQAQSFIYFQF